MSIPSRLHFTSPIKLALLALLAFATLGLAFSPGANGAKLKNGDFEKGTFSGWKRDSANNGGRWMIYERGKSMPISSNSQPPTIAGKYSAVSDMGDESAMILYRDFTIPKKAKLKSATLTFQLSYWNSSSSWMPKPALNKLNVENQQFRVDLIKPKKSANWSTKKSAVLKNVIKSKTGMKQQSKKKKYKVNLNKLAGKKIRLRFANANSLSFLHVVVDNVKLKIKTK